jgi:hypothetical protein
MELQDALVQVSEIRRQMAKSETFRGYRSVPAALSAAIAVGTAALQPVFVVDPAANPEKYCKLWVSAALVSALVGAGEMIVRCLRSASPLTTRMALLVVEQFLPCTLVGGMVTLVLSLGASDGMWMIPGLWGLFFSLGLFATARFLPRPIFAVAVYYFVCGLGALAFGQGEWAYSPWIMAIMFGGGQLMAAIILHLTRERPHGNS